MTPKSPNLIECQNIVLKKHWYGNTMGEHDYVYSSKTKRKCLKCGVKQLLFGYQSYEGHLFEDWRTTI